MTDKMKPARNIERLIEIMAALRTPDTGCPWDLEQSFETIAPYTIEEAYEVADAIERSDMVDLVDELGDLLLQVVYHTRLAEEEDAFDFGDVVQAITTKMIRRHPHVFGDEDQRTAGQVKGMWDRIKAEERAEKNARRQSAGQTTDVNELAGLLDHVPAALPALTRATKLQHKAAKVGFDWPDIRPVFAKLKEEIAEFESEARQLDPRAPAPAQADIKTDTGQDERSKAAVEEEFGDILFVMANIARHLDIDAEGALRAANSKFTRRFGYIEKRLAERNKTPAESDLEEMDALWDEIRAADKQNS